MTRRRIVVGVGGATGHVYAHRTLRFLAEHAARLGLEVHLAFTRVGRMVFTDETGVDPATYGFPIYRHDDMTAPFASGSARFESMVVVPCSGGGLSRIAHGLCTDLVGRGAEVMLKERRKLVLVVRESPYSLALCRNMVAVTEAGAVVLPGAPTFYSAPQGTDELLDTVTARILDQLDIDNDLMRRWEGRGSARAHGGM